MSVDSHEKIGSQNEEDVEEDGSCSMIHSIRNDAASQLMGMLQVSREDAYKLIDSSLNKLPIENSNNDNNHVDHAKRMALLESVIDDAMTSHFDSNTDSSNFQCDSRKRKKREDETTKFSANKTTKKIIKNIPTTTTTSRPHTLCAYFTIKNETEKKKSTKEVHSSIKSNSEFNHPYTNKLQKNNDADNDEDDDVIIIESEKNVESRSADQSEVNEIENKISLDQSNNVNCKDENISKITNTTDMERNFGQQDFDAYQLAQNYLLNSNKQHMKKSLSPPFLHLCEALSSVCATTKRLKKEHILTDLFLTLLYFDRSKYDAKQYNQNEKHPVNCVSTALQALLICGDVALNGYKLNIGHSIISQSLCSALSCSSSTLKQRINATGEMGDAAASIFLGISDESSNFTKKHLKQTRLNWKISKSKSLEIKDIFRCISDLHSLSNEGGKGIETKKKEILRNLFSTAQHHEEIRFAVKILCHNLRTGATLITAMRCFAAAHILQVHNVKNAYNDESKEKYKVKMSSPNTSLGHYKEQITEFQEFLRIAYAKHHDLVSCIKSLVWNGGQSLSNCNVEVMIPVQPLLASPSRGIVEVLEHYKKFWEEEKETNHCTKLLPNVSAEFKYDGQRAQIHYNKTTKNIAEVKIFSRHLDEITTKFDSVANWILNCKWPVTMNSFILDTEIVAVERNGNKSLTILPFQVLSTLKRDTSSMNTAGDLLDDNRACPDSIMLCIFAFDLLYLNGSPIIHKSFFERRKLLYNEFESVTKEGYFQFAKKIDLSFEGKGISPLCSQLESFLIESVGPGKCEGLMLKSLQSKYSSWETREKSGGNGGWRKLKKDYVDALADSFDVIPIGAWRGNGRKSKWFSPFLLAVYNDETGEYESICRCMSGFSDEFYQSSHDRFNGICLQQKPSYYRTNETPTFWFPPKEVWEVRGADLTESPVHHAGQNYLWKESHHVGISLRFPRFIRLREDKKVEDATSPEQVFKVFSSQSQRN